MGKYFKKFEREPILPKDPKLIVFRTKIEGEFEIEEQDLNNKYIEDEIKLKKILTLELLKKRINNAIKEINK